MRLSSEFILFFILGLIVPGFLAVVSLNNIFFVSWRPVFNSVLLVFSVFSLAWVFLGAAFQVSH